LISGRWQDNETQRSKRVGQILAVIEANFDPKLLRNGTSEPVNLSVEKFRWWVLQRFGSGIEAELTDLRRFDPVSLTAPTQRVFVPAQFIETFLAVADFCLNHDQLENKAVPTNRFKKLWGMVKNGAAWNQSYFQIVRDRLDRMGIVKIIDRQHTKGKAWRWEATPHFPSESWKAEQQKLKERCRGSGFGQSFDEFITDISNDTHNKLHNTLYKSGSENRRLSAPHPDSRPPPDW
jgi:hypothetical protein